MAEPYFDRVAIVGVGLIGGSLAMVLKDKGLCNTIVGVGRGKENLEAAKRMGLIDEYTHDVEEGVKGADLVVLAVPVMSIEGVVKRAAASFKAGAIVTDVGSVKEGIINAVTAHLPEGVHFVAAHPIAGTENSGAEASVKDLYVGKRCIITPTDKTDKAALEKIKALWKSAGSEVVTMEAREHDIILAAVSHLPHVIAYALVNSIADAGNDMERDVISYSAGGFKDTTRIASSSPDMWTDICRMNKEALVGVIEGFQEALEDIKTSIEGDNTELIKRSFERAKKVRDSLKK